MLSSTNMLLFKAIRDPKVFSLWIGQVFSAMGDEIYRVAFIWLSVQLIGANAGYLASLQLLASVLMTVFGARIVDRFHSEEAMIRLDFYRAGIVLIPVTMHLLNIPSFVTLAICSLILAALSALFDPVVMETLPKIVSDRSILKGAIGLMSTTTRLARVTGPILVGFLSSFIPMIHFFTIDAITFMISAYSIHSLKIKKAPPKQMPPLTATLFIDTLLEAIRLLRSKPEVMRTLMAKGFVAGAWGLSFWVGLALFANEISPNDITTFGMIMSAYGIGNVVGALVIGNMQRRSPEKMVYTGLMWLGLCFILFPLSHSLPVILVLVALSALGGPWNDLPFVDLVQTHYSNQSISKIFRLRNTLEMSCTFILMAISPLILKSVNIRVVISTCGAMILISGLVGEGLRRRNSIH